MMARLGQVNVKTWSPKQPTQQCLEHHQICERVQQLEGVFLVDAKHQSSAPEACHAQLKEGQHIAVWALRQECEDAVTLPEQYS